MCLFFNHVISNLNYTETIISSITGGRGGGEAGMLGYYHKPCLYQVSKTYLDEFHKSIMPVSSPWRLMF